MRKLALFFAKTVLRNTSFWVWSVLFLLFWAAMGAYVFSRGVTKERLVAMGVPEHLIEQAWADTVRGYAAGWFSAIVTVSFASTSSVLVSYIYYSTVPLRYLSKFSRASTGRVLASFILGALAVFLLSSLILYAVCLAMFNHRFDVVLLPGNPLGVLASSVAYALVAYLLSTTLALATVVLRRPKLVEKAAFVPLTFGVVFVMLSVHVGGGLFYLAPFNSAMALIYYYFTNLEPPYDEPLAFARPGYEPLSPLRAWAVLAFWLALLLATSAVLLRRQRGVPAEELAP